MLDPEWRCCWMENRFRSIFLRDEAMDYVENRSLLFEKQVMLLNETVNYAAFNIFTCRATSRVVD